MNSSDELNVAAVVKLLDYVSSGIGSVAGPMLATWRARREAQAKRIAAKGEADALLIQAEAQSKAREILLSQDTEISGELDISDAVHQRIQPGFPIWNPPSPLSVARNRSTCNSPSNDGHLRADPDDWGPIGGVGGAEWHFCRRSGRTDPVGGDAKERGAVAHAGAGGGLSRSIRRRMSANRSRGMTTSAIWNVT